MSTEMKTPHVITRNWGWYLALGAALVVLGTIALGMSLAMTVVTVMYFGILLLIGGAVAIVHSFVAREWSGFFLQLLIGVLYVAAGGYMLTSPLQASLVLTLVLGLSILVTGVARIILALSVRHLNGWAWMFISGLLAAAVGGMILAQWPSSALWVIGLFVAIELILNGWGLVMLSLAARSAKDNGAASSSEA